MTEIWAAVTTLLTLVAGGGWLFDKKRHRQEVRSIKTENEKKDMELAKMYVDEFKTNIAEPLRREVRGLKKEVKNLNNAIAKIQDCPHAGECPVYDELQKQQADDDRADREGGEQ